MAELAQLAESAGHRYAALRPHLDERQRRLVLGSEASELGRGGIKAIADVTGVHPDTIARGVREITGKSSPMIVRMVVDLPGWDGQSDLLRGAEWLALEGGCHGR